MIEKEINRTHVILGGRIRATTEERWVNGDGHEVSVTSSEDFKSQKEIQDMLEKHIPDKEKETLQELEKLQEKQKNIISTVRDIIGTREYIKFKKYIHTEEFKNLFNTYKNEEELKKTDKSLEYYTTMHTQIQAWKKQFEDIAQDMQDLPTTTENGNKA